MLMISMLFSCILMTNHTTLADDGVVVLVDSSIALGITPPSSTGTTAAHLPTSSMTSRTSSYAVTCYICVNVSDNRICNQYAIDRPCRPGETFCHTLHIMDSRGGSVLVNKKCTTPKECQRNQVGCVEIDRQLMCVSCCDHDYCNVNVPSNVSSANYDDKVTRMRSNSNNHFHSEREKALTTAIKDGTQRCADDTGGVIVWLSLVASTVIRYQ